MYYRCMEETPMAAKSYEVRLKNHINTCGNTARIYILHGAPKIAKDFAIAAAKSAFKLHPELREVA
jgi:hypothetical protein